MLTVSFGHAQRILPQSTLPHRSEGPLLDDHSDVGEYCSSAPTPTDYRSRESGLVRRPKAEPQPI